MSDGVIENFGESFDMSAFSVDPQAAEQATDQTESQETESQGQEEPEKEQENINETGEGERIPEEVASEETSEDDTDPTSVEAEEEDESDDTSGDGEDDSSPGELYSSLADTMKENGILSSLDPEKLKGIKDADSLLEAFKEEVSAREYADLTERQKTYLQGLRDGIPEEEVVDHINVTEQLNGIQEQELESNEALRKALIVEKLKIVNNFSPEKAERYASKAIELGDDFEEANEALTDLKQAKQKEFEQAQLEKQKAIEAEQQKVKETIDNFKNKIDQSKEIFEGMELTKAEKEKLFNQMTTQVGTSEEGRALDAISKARMEDPEEFTLKLHYLFMATNGFKDINKFVKKSKTKAASELDKVLRSQQSASAAGNSNNGVPDGPSDFGNLGNII